MIPLSVDDREVWLLILQHLHMSAFGQLARQLEQGVVANGLLPQSGDAPGARCAPGLKSFCAIISVLR
jgi:hypothetical protein